MLDRLNLVLEPATTAIVGPARVDEITRRLPAGDRTVVGEAGTALSGGERQRVNIARADRVLFLGQGRILEDGTVEGLRAYGHRFRALLATPARRGGVAGAGRGRR
ncbi:hypothetical protein [Amycolatopsis sp. YIM 10]|uniref:hypothetical protein n=1 Tax=Amycolatopsis sp. YIM 10 TaxID=2653857 RepID=UPI002714F22B|nr:hypothetical protein [Amycolatopsis sp. YIM 10]